MSWNSFGHLFRLTSWGESHGPAIGAVVDGCPPGLPLTEDEIQVWLDRRRPGGTRFTSQRREPDRIKILSGTFEGRTTGAPIGLAIDNVDARPKDYGEVERAFRPGHADFVTLAKYGLRDWRGGGRSSARETAMRVAAGAIARKILEGVTIRAYLVELGGDPIDRTCFDLAEVDRNPFHSPDAGAARRWGDALDQARRDGTSLGAVLECVATGVPVGWGAPVYARLDAELAGAMMSINAVKGVEIGEGFNAARIPGHLYADQMAAGEDGPTFLGNHDGGTAGGIATGQPLVVRLAFKPTPSIRCPLRTIGEDGSDREISTRGRHDPCVGIRGAAVAEAMMAFVLADQKLLHRAQCGAG
jgi:chorismate synthase